MASQNFVCKRSTIGSERRTLHNTDDYVQFFTDLADNVLMVNVDAPSPYDSMVSCIALIEALVAGVVDRLGDARRCRISALERLREGFAWDDREIPHHDGEP